MLFRCLSPVVGGPCGTHPGEATLKRMIPVLAVLAAITVAGGNLLADPPQSAPAGNAASEPPKEPAIDSGDTAWMLVSTGLVMFMVPGLALFYGGIVRRKNLLGTMMHSMVALGIIGVQWLLFGYSLAFGDSHVGIIGWSNDFLGLNGVSSSDAFHGTNIPIY